MSNSFDWSWSKGHVNPDDFWHPSMIRALDYAREEFNDGPQERHWRAQGHQPRTGGLFDMRNPNQPSTTAALAAWAERRGLEHIGVSYYKMGPGDNLPYHGDIYRKYIEIFDLEDRKHDIIRYIFFVENKKPGHIFEIDGRLIDWQAGDYVGWRYDAPHMAANLGIEDRFTIQVTGVIRADQ